MLNGHTQNLIFTGEHRDKRNGLIIPAHEHRRINLSNEYIRGLVDGEGCFSFSTTTSTYMGKVFKRNVPAFIIQMHVRDRCLIEAVAKHLGLKNEVYMYPPYPNHKDSFNRGWSARLIVREFISLRDIIIPFFHNKLKGHKGEQFMVWLEKIGSDPNISDKFKSLYQLYKSGAYDADPRFTEKFRD